METKNQTIDKFIGQLASSEPTPGGGSVAAMQGALGCGLIAMVADLTVGKKGYEGHFALNEQAFESATEYMNTFLSLIDKDIEEFTRMSKTFSMPNKTDSEKSARKAAVQAALKACYQPPALTMELALKSLELCKSMQGKSNAMAQSDLGCAATNLKSCAQNAWLNVLANINYMQDKVFAEKERTRLSIVLKSCEHLADEIFGICL